MGPYQISGPAGGTEALCTVQIILELIGERHCAAEVHIYAYFATST